MRDRWTAHFPGLHSLEPGLRDEVERAGHIVRVPQGTSIFGPGRIPENYVLLLEGDIRVAQVSESGREIVLYRVLPGESCAMTTVCLLGQECYNAEAIAETDVVAVVIPQTSFDNLMARSADFRRFVLRTLSHRIIDLFRLVEEIAFQRLDVRLAQKLIELAGESDTLIITHQQIATELGTAREVVSRQLHEMHRRGWVAPRRGSLELLDRSALQHLAREG